MTTTIADRRHEPTPIPPEIDRRKGEDRRQHHLQRLVIITDTRTFEADVARYGEIIEYAREEFGCEVSLVMKEDELALAKFPFLSEHVMYLADFRGSERWVFELFEAARSLEVTTVALYSGETGFPPFVPKAVAHADSQLNQKNRHHLRNLIQAIPDDFKTMELIKSAINATFVSLRAQQEQSVAA